MPLRPAGLDGVIVQNNPVNRVDPSGYADVTLTNSSGGGGSISVEPITVINLGDIPQNGRTSGGATAPTAVAAPFEGLGDNRAVYGFVPPVTTGDTKLFPIVRSFPKMVYPVDIAANVDEARNHMNILDFWEASRTGGDWDFKKNGNRKSFEQFGNYHFGVMSRAFEFNEKVTLRGAGFYQHLTDLKNIFHGRPWVGTGFFLGRPPYGDDENDQVWIKRGYEDGLYYIK